MLVPDGRIVYADVDFPYEWHLNNQFLQDNDKEYTYKLYVSDVNEPENNFGHEAKSLASFQQGTEGFLSTGSDPKNLFGIKM